MALNGYDSWLQPPDPEPFHCLEHDDEDECGGTEDDCREDDGCNICGAPLARWCRCDDLYEASKEDRFFD